MFAISWMIKEILLPLGSALVYSNTFMDLAYQCETAMDDSWYLRQMDSPQTNAEVVQLLSCHDYDKTRKIMLASGLPEDYLSYLGLKALELHQKSPEEFVKKHRFVNR